MEKGYDLLAKFCQEESALQNAHGFLPCFPMSIKGQLSNEMDDHVHRTALSVPQFL